MSKQVRGFLTWCKFIITRPKPLPVVLEIEKGTPKWNEDDQAAILLLAEHPGYKALLKKLNIQRAYLKFQLENTKHDNLREVDTIVIGLHWLGRVQSEISKAVQDQNDQQKRTRPVTDTELVEIERIKSSIESIGTDRS